MSQGRLQACCWGLLTQMSAGSVPITGLQTSPPRPPHLHLPSSGSQLVPPAQLFAPPSGAVHCAPPWHCAGGPSEQICTAVHVGPPGPPHLQRPSTGSQVVPPPQVTPVQALPGLHVRAV